MKIRSVAARMSRTLALGLGLLAASGGWAAGVKVLEPRLGTVKPTTPELDSDTPVQRLVVKFQEGTRVRIRQGLIQALSGERGPEERKRMRRQGLSDERLLKDVLDTRREWERMRRFGPPGRLFREDEATLAERKSTAEDLSGREMADSDLYYEVPLQPGARAEDVNALIMRLNALDSVEIAYAEPVSEPASVDFGVADRARSSTPSGVTSLFDGQQGYLGPGPVGIDARYAWTQAGGRGQGVKLVDVEGAWNDRHEDMPDFFYEGGVPLADLEWRQHGTAVMGVMAGEANGFGVTGIAHAAQVGREGIGQQSMASAITHAARAVGRGGVVLVELQALGPRTVKRCACNTSQCNYVPLEYWRATFDAIAQATAQGVHVVEAAGNGGVDLDDPAYRGAFNRAQRDSGAILVAASTATTRAPMCWTNYGNRVDVHGWGEKVVTLGYGDLSGATENRGYTATFSGTSSAAPMVAGAVACLQGAATAAGKGAVSPRTLREALRVTGTPQASSAKEIGPLPNLRAALPRVLGR